MYSYSIFMIPSLTFIMLRWSDILLLMCCYVSLTLVWSKSGCQKMYHYRVAPEENTNLSCTMSVHCLRGLWKSETDNKWFLQDGCTDCGDNFAVITNLPLGLNILQVSNVSENDAGVYYCECEYFGYKSTILERETVACFNLTIYRPDCRMSVDVNGKIFRFYGYYNEATKENINVTVNDRIQVECSYEAKRKTNCSHLENNGVLVSYQSHQRCKFTCISSRSNMICKIKLIVHSLPPNSLTSPKMSPARQWITNPSTRSTSTSRTSRASPRHFTNTKVTPFSTPESFSALLTDDIKSTEYQLYTRDVEKSTAFYKNVRLTGVSFATTFDTDIVTKASTSGFPHVYNSSYRSLTTSRFVSTRNDINISLIIISCAIFLTSIIVALFCVYMFGLHMYGDNKEWVAPIYESVDNDIQPQGVIQIASNQNEDGDAEVMGACSAPSSLKMSILNGKQINCKAESKGGSTVASEVTLCDPTDTLSHRVTSFNEDFIESSKTGVSEDDKFHTVKESNLETIGLSETELGLRHHIYARTITSSTCDGPTSHHIYEVSLNV